MNDYSGSLHLRAVLPEELANQFLTQKPKALSSSGFAALLIEEALSVRRSVLNYAPTVSVRETPGNTGTKAQPSNEVQETSSEVQSSPTREHKKVCVSFLGDGVGKEPEETPRKGLSFSRQLPTDLEPFQALIDDFWRVKQGSKGKVAWSRLLRNLSSILAKYGNAVLSDQLELAINGKWQGIELTNYERFKTADKAPETKHPAAKVFTAKDFDNGPTTNTALSDLF